MKPYLHNSDCRALIFDLDGTLYPRKVYYDEYFNFALRTISDIFGKSLSEAEDILAKSGIVRNPRSDRVGSVTSVMRTLGMSREDWNSYRDKWFDISPLVREDPQMESALKRLAQTFALALLSNNTLASMARILRKLGVSEGLFSVQVSSDINLPPKPDPAVYEYIAKRMQLGFERIISVGDRYEVDIRPFLSLGGNGILIDGPQELYGLPEFLAKIRNKEGHA